MPNKAKPVSKKPSVTSVPVNQSELTDIKKAIATVDNVAERKLGKPEAAVVQGDNIMRASKIAKEAKQQRKVAKEAVAKPNPVAATVDETKKQKKAVVKVEKEDELTRRLTRAKSTLMSGLAAAIGATPAPTKAEENEVTTTSAQPPAPKQSFMTKPTTATPVKHGNKVSFDDLGQTKETKPTQKPAKVATGKVSFDSLTAGASQDQSAELDVSRYFKK